MLPKEDYITVSKSVLCMVKKEKKKGIPFALQQ